MAILTGLELGDHISDMETASKAVFPINYTKNELRLMMQAIEDQFEAFRPTLNAAINAATAPYVFPAAAKAAAVKSYLRRKFERGG